MAEIEMLPSWAGRIVHEEPGQELVETKEVEDAHDVAVQTQPPRRRRSRLKIALILLVLALLSIGSGLLAAYITVGA